jgi:hypothetical protein
LRLLKENPDDPRTYEVAINACIERGWSNRAAEYGKELIELDPGNEKGHLIILRDSGEMYSPFSLGAIAEIVESHGKQAPMVCSLVTKLCLDGDYSEEDDDDLEYEQSTFPGFEIEVKKSRTTEPWNDLNFMLDKYHKHTIDIDGEKRNFTQSVLVNSILPDIYKHDKFELAPNVDRIIKNIEKEDIFEHPAYKLVSAGYAATLARQSGIPKIIVALAVLNAFIDTDICPEQDIEDFRTEIILYEYEIILQLPQIKKYIKRFKKDFVDLYIHSADFFDNVLFYNENKMYSELDRRSYRYDRIDTRLILDWLGVDEYEARMAHGSDRPQNVPIRSEKIGRNAPCPCNSGKKYKKCCGA